MTRLLLMLVKLVSLLSSEAPLRTETVHCFSLAVSYSLHMTIMNMRSRWKDDLGGKTKNRLRKSYFFVLSKSHMNGHGLESMFRSAKIAPNCRSCGIACC